jgi:hypothetical protein
MVSISSEQEQLRHVPEITRNESLLSDANLASVDGSARYQAPQSIGCARLVQGCREAGQWKAAQQTKAIVSANTFAALQ